MRAAPFLAVLVAGAACSEPTETVVVVTVEARPSVLDAEALDVTISNAGSSVTNRFDIRDREFPVTFSVTPGTREGSLGIEVVALDAQDLERGVGRASAAIVADDESDATVMLDPSDFVVNSSIAGDQRPTFLFERSGRQIAAGDDGRFIVAFVNDCAMLGRCDLFARLFDENGAPAQNGVTMDDEEFIANLSQETASVPAVAVGPNGLYVAWETIDDVRGVALTAGGEHRGSELIISNNDELPGDSSVAALGSGDYVVVWAQGFGSEIRARLVTEDGQARLNVVTGDTLDFPVSTEALAVAERPSVVATGQGHAFVVVWRSGTAIKARFFNTNGAPETTDEVTLASYAGGTVFGPHVAWHDGVAIVVWGVQHAGTAGLENGA